ncbi:MAG: GNAT family N-acetyltransferase, partial [Betaproteobacteria bacterium]
MPIRNAQAADAPTVVALIHELAAFEQLSHLVSVTPQSLAQHLFGPQPAAQCVVFEQGTEIVAFALFFHNFST